MKYRVVDVSGALAGIFSSVGYLIKNLSFFITTTKTILEELLLYHFHI